MIEQEYYLMGTGKENKIHTLYHICIYDDGEMERVYMGNLAIDHDKALAKAQEIVGHGIEIHDRAPAALAAYEARSEEVEVSEDSGMGFIPVVMNEEGKSRGGGGESEAEKRRRERRIERENAQLERIKKGLYPFGKNEGVPLADIAIKLAGYWIDQRDSESEVIVALGNALAAIHPDLCNIPEPVDAFYSQEGEAIECDVICTGSFSYEGYHGYVGCVKMVVAGSNEELVYHGTAFWLERGDRTHITATVKRHGYYHDKRQTIIKRPVSDEMRQYKAEVSASKKAINKAFKAFQKSLDLESFVAYLRLTEFHTALTGNAHHARGFWDVEIDGVKLSRTDLYKQGYALIDNENGGIV
jgi:methionine aminopeptidase